MNTPLSRSLVAGMLLTSVLILAVRGQSPTPPRLVRIQMPKMDMSDALKLYAHLSGRKVWVELGVTAKKVTIFTPHDIPLAEALSLIRGTLLNDYGIDIREVGDTEAFVTFNVNPQTKAILRSPSPLVTPSFSASLSPTPPPHVRGVTKKPPPN